MYFIPSYLSCTVKDIMSTHEFFKTEHSGEIFLQNKVIEALYWQIIRALGNRLATKSWRKSCLQYIKSFILLYLMCDERGSDWSS